MVHSERQQNNGKWIIRVGLASCGIAAGGLKVFDSFKTTLAAKRLSNVELIRVGCFGMCYNEVLVDVTSPHGERTFYKKTRPEYIERIVTEHIINNQAVAEWAVPSAELDSFLGKQKRIVLRNCGINDPESITAYLNTSGYQAIEKVLNNMSPQEVINEMISSGLRGRGGAGFSTGTKWDLCRKSPGFQKYVICNADEGDPGAFMDRSVLESDPHTVLEGMLIAGYTIGATEGFIYVRAEYPLAVRRLELALAQAREQGFIGANILGHNFDFQLSIRQGAGAFVCGEETALMMSIEGKRGMPKSRILIM
jgi:NADH-quinone oxidoreductase subunit F